MKYKMTLRYVTEEIKRTDPTPDDALSFSGQRRFPLYTWNLDRTEYDVIYREAEGQ